MTRLLLALVLIACASESPTGTTAPLPDTAVVDIAQDVQVAPDLPPPPPDLSAEETPAPPDVPEPDAALEEDIPELPPICVPFNSVCESLTLQKVCRADGSAWDELPCGDATICLNGACGPPACTPGEVVCEGAKRMVCDELGSGTIALPCAPGYGCADGECRRVRANVILIVDTSGSMDFKATEAPGACNGTPCPGFPFPVCEDPEAPTSRLGVTKAALQKLFASKVVDGARLALQRFPQRGSSYGTCGSGYYYDVGDLTCDNDAKHELDEICLTGALSEFMVVPIDPSTGSTDAAALTEWVDFDEAVAKSTDTCTYDTQCPSWICLDGQCAQHTQEELRPTGATPLGKALYYAGEYLRLRILLQGKPCDGNADCASSPDHKCVDGKCHDPFHTCRKNAIVLFTDGEETSHPEATDFWNPWNQAKRLHYGLGCAADVQCASGATCEAGLCTPPPNLAPTGKCAATFEPCLTSAECPGYFCGKSDACPGHCTLPDVPFTDPLAKNYLKGWDKLPVPLTVHVADASGGTVVDNAMIAAWGGGQHVLVDFEDIDALFLTLYDLVDLKQGNACE